MKNFWNILLVGIAFTLFIWIGIFIIDMGFPTMEEKTELVMSESKAIQEMLKDMSEKMETTHLMFNFYFLSIHDKLEMMEKNYELRKSSVKIFQERQNSRKRADRPGGDRGK